MKKLNYLIAIACTVLFASCAKVDVKPVEPEEVSYKISIHAELPELLEQGDTKATAQTGIRLMWTTSDKISVINATKKEILKGQLHPRQDGSSVQLEGTVTPKEGSRIDNDDKIILIYPEISNGTEATDLPASVALTNMSDQSIDGTYSKFVAYATTTGSAITTAKNLKFNCVNAFITLNVVNLAAATPTVGNVSVRGAGATCAMTLNSSDEPVFTATKGDIALSGNKQAKNNMVVLRVATYASPEGDQKTVELKEAGTAKVTNWTSGLIEGGHFYNSVAKGFKTLPTVTTNDATAVEAKTATLNGSITTAEVAVTGRGFCYGTSQNPTAENAASTTGDFKLAVSNLTHNTTYYVRAYAKTEYGTHYGEQVSFKTKTGAVTMTLGAAADLTATSAKFSVSDVTRVGTDITIQEYGLVYLAGTSGDPTVSNEKIKLGENTNVTSFNGSITGLTNDTTYRVRAYAVNETGTYYSSTVEFKTLKIESTGTTGETFLEQEDI